MRRFGRRLRKLATLAARGEFSAAAAGLREHVWSDRRALVLRRDLWQPFDRPGTPVAFSIRPYGPGDADILFDPGSPDERAERRKLESWMERGMKGCYVAVLGDGRATFVQWLCTPSDNEPLRDIFDGVLPVVEPGTVLLEGAYTPRRFRRLPVMPAAMARIAEEGRCLGARWALVSISEDNVSMIRAAQMAGFIPWRLKGVRRRLFRRSVSYSELPDGPESSPATARGRLRPGT